MKKSIQSVAGCLAVGSVLLLSGCATTITQPKEERQPAKEKFGTFKAYEIEHVTVSKAFAEAAANKKAAKKIDEDLISNMKNVFQDIKVVDASVGKTDIKTLVIRPVVKEIKFIGGAARFWVGPMAGSSAVLMEVSYIDKQTETVLASPLFYCSANAWGGGMSMGGADNMMLSRIVLDIVNYTTSNR